MKKFLVSVFFLGLFVFGVIYTSRIPYSPCDTPKTYRVGRIDGSFGMRKDEAVATTQKAADILNLSYGKELFRYSQDGEIVINFSYDERSALNESINLQKDKVDSDNLNLQKKIDSYESDLQDFLLRLDNYNTKVQSYNAQGGAPPGVYQELNEERIRLEAEGRELNTRADRLNLETTNFNTKVKDLNRDVDAFNEAVGRKPEEGVFDPNTNSITVYFLADEDELTHTLSHELGHALGMEHVDDETAIMYSWSSKSLNLSEADLQELAFVCRSMPLPYHYLDVLNEASKNLLSRIDKSLVN